MGAKNSSEKKTHEEKQVRKFPRRIFAKDFVKMGNLFGKTNEEWAEVYNNGEPGSPDSDVWTGNQGGQVGPPGGKKKKFRSIDPRSISDDVERTPIQASPKETNGDAEACTTPIHAAFKKNPTQRFKTTIDPRSPSGLPRTPILIKEDEAETNEVVKVETTEDAATPSCGNIVKRGAVTSSLAKKLDLDESESLTLEPVLGEEPVRHDESQHKEEAEVEEMDHDAELIEDEQVESVTIDDNVDQDEEKEDVETGVPEKQTENLEQESGEPENETGDDESETKELECETKEPENETTEPANETDDTENESDNLVAATPPGAQVGHSLSRLQQDFHDLAGDCRSPLLIENSSPPSHQRTAGEKSSGKKSRIPLRVVPREQPNIRSSPEGDTEVNRMLKGVSIRDSEDENCSEQENSLVI